MINFHQLDTSLKQSLYLIYMDKIAELEAKQKTLKIDEPIELQDMKWDELQRKIDILREGMK